VKNCLTYALGMWLKHGGYLLIRKSRFVDEFPGANWWHPAHLVPHFLHRSKEMVITQYLPTDADRAASVKLGAFRRWLKLWHFDGHITGDDKVEADGN